MIEKIEESFGERVGKTELGKPRLVLFAYLHSLTTSKDVSSYYSHVGADAFGERTDAIGERTDALGERTDAVGKRTL